MSRWASYLVISALVLTTSAFAGSIIVNNDEWSLSNAGFSSAGVANGTNFAQNAAQFLTGGPSGGTTKIWIDSGNFGLAGSNLMSSLSAYSLTDTGSFSTFTLANLQGYSAVFLGGDNLTAAEESALVSYISGGGNVYIAAGTGSISGGSAGEAAQWNAVLNSFSLNLASTYNGISGNIATNSASPILNGVTQLYYDNGNSVSVTGANAQIITQTGGQGLIGVYSTSTSSAPEPSTAILIVAAFAGLGVFKARRRS